MTIEKSHKPSSTTSAQDHTASTPLQYTHMHTMQNYLLSVTAHRLDSFTRFRNNSNKNCAALTLVPDQRLSLSQQKLQGFGSLLTSGTSACCNIRVTYCIAFQRSESGCSSQPHMALPAGGVLYSARFSSTVSVCGG